MTRHILIAQSQPQAQDIFTSIFKDWGDTVEQASNLNELGTKLRVFTPNLLIFDITLLGKDWPQKIPTIRQKLPNTDILFTHNAVETLPQKHIEEYKRWGVLTGPFSRYSVRYALQEGYAQFKGRKQSPAPKPHVRFPLRFKLTWPYLVLALLFTLAMAFIITRVVFDSMEERFSNQLIEAGRLSSEWMVAEEMRLLETLRFIANTQGVAQALAEGDTESLKRVALPIAINDQIEAVDLLNLDGENLLSLYLRTGGTPEDYAITKGDTLFQEWEIVRAVLEGRVDAIGNKFAALHQTATGSYFYVSGPVYGTDGEVVGVVLVAARLDTLVQNMRAVTLAQTSLYGLDGQVLASSFITPHALQSEDADAILSQQDQSSALQHVTVSNVAYTELLGPWEARHDEDLGILSVALPQNFLIQTSFLTRAQIMAIIIITLGLIVVIGFLSAGRISFPVRQLMRASNEVSQGNLRVELEQKGADELTALTYYFNEMVANLRKSNLEIMEAYESSLEGWSRALTLRDHDTEEHSKRVVEITMRVARALDIGERELVHIHRGALLHDIGKMAVPDSILLKPEGLTSEEREIIEQHPVHAYKMLKDIPFLKDSLDIPRFHHERWDGKGYPHGLREEEIPIAARIFSIADVYDALASDRPYRRAWSLPKILDYLQSHKGSAFDPQLVDLFFELYGDGFDEFQRLLEGDPRMTLPSSLMRPSIKT